MRKCIRGLFSFYDILIEMNCSGVDIIEPTTVIASLLMLLNLNFDGCLVVVKQISYPIGQPQITRSVEVQLTIHSIQADNIVNIGFSKINAEI